jgi:glutamate racemase
MTAAVDQRPIGVFDSGVGGLSVLRAIRAELPFEQLVYVADSGYAPYGDRPREFIESRALAICDFLLERRVKAVVVACNTATGAAVHVLRERLTIPVIAIEPAVKPAALQTRSGVVGVLATAGTLSSPKFLDLVDRHGAGVQVLVQPCPGLAERIEAGDLASEDTRELVTRLVRPLLEKSADTLVLGCTHYPFVRELIAEAAGPRVTIIDPATAVARELRRRLAAAGLQASQPSQPAPETDAVEFWTSGDPASVGEVVSLVWGRPVAVRLLPKSPQAVAPELSNRSAF